RMHNDVLMTIRGNAPVEAPFEQRKRVRRGKGQEGPLAVEIELRLRLNPSAHDAGTIHGDVEVGELVARRNFVRRVVECDGGSHGLEGRLDFRNDRTGSYAQSRSRKPLPKLAGG